MQHKKEREKQREYGGIVPPHGRPTWSTQNARTAKAAGPHSKTLLPYYKFINPSNQEEETGGSGQSELPETQFQKTKVNPLTTLYSKMPFHAYQEDVRKNLVSGLAGRWGTTSLVHS